MILRIRLLVAVVTAIVIVVYSNQLAHAQSPATDLQLKVIQTFKLGGSGRWDVPVVEREDGRLYLSRGNRVQVIDLDNGTALGEIAGLRDAHGTVIGPARDRGFITCGSENAVAVFDTLTFKVLRKIKIAGDGGKNPNAILYDSSSRQIFVFCAGGDAVVINPDDLDGELTSVPCGGKLAFAVADGAGKVFVNVEDKNEIVVIDSQSHEATARWPVAPVTAPSGLAIDTVHHRLFCVGENEIMAVIDNQNGKVLATVDIGKNAGGCVCDPTLGFAVSANGADATATVVREGTPGQFSAVQTLKTVKAGRTIANDASTGRFFIPGTVRAEGGAPAQLGILVIGVAK